jgi:hypothetical protein
LYLTMGGLSELRAEGQRPVGKTGSLGKEEIQSREILGNRWAGLRPGQASPTLPLLQEGRKIEWVWTWAV